MNVRRLTLSGVVSLCAVLSGVLVLACAPAFASKQYVPGVPASFGGAGSGDGQFTEPTGLAVNDSSEPLVEPAAGDVYVLDTGNNRLERFGSTGMFIAAWGWGVADGQAKYEVCTSGCRAGIAGVGEGQFNSPQTVAVDDSASLSDPSRGDVYVANGGESGVVEKFSATGELIGELTGTCASGPCSGEEAFGELKGVAVDPSGNLWVYDGSVRNVDEFSATGSFLKAFNTGRGSQPGMAVDAGGDVYVVSGEPTALRFDSATGEQVAQFAEGASGLALNPATEDLLVDRGTSIDLNGPFGEPYTEPLQTFPADGLAESKGIAVKGTTSAVYASEAGAGDVKLFNYLTLPSVSTGSASQVSETGQTLHGTVNPEGEAITACRFEYAIYGTEAGVYPHTVPCQQAPAAIGSGAAPVSVSAEVSGLRPASTYHFRLVASNANGTAHGADMVFTATGTVSGSAPGLPDKRAYELVSTIGNLEVWAPETGQPVSNFAEENGVMHGNYGGFRAAADGDTVAYIGGLPPSGVGGYSEAGKNGQGDLYLSARGAQGWETSNIEPVTKSRELDGFSADLSAQIFTIGEPKFNSQRGVSPECAQIVYSRGGGVGAPTYGALFTPTPGVPGECQYLTYAGVSADGSHTLFESAGAYTAGAVKGEEGVREATEFELDGQYQGYDNLYDRVGSDLHQVNILPDGEPEPNPSALFGGRVPLAGQAFEHSLGKIVSADGSRVFWSSLRTGALYVRENDTQPQSRVVGEHCTEPAKACTVQLDAAQPGAAGPGGGGQFWTVSSDGSRVFFTDCRRLTMGSTSVSAGGCVREAERVSEGVVLTGNDLYEYDLSNGRLIDLTIDGSSADPLGADVQGVIGTSEDGTSVYFVANGVLAGENAEGTKPVAGEPNLYMARAGSTTFVATLTGSDDLIDGEVNVSLFSLVGDWRATPGLRTAAVAASGDVVVFISRQPLTGYDNHGLLGYAGTGHQPVFGSLPEVFVYEAGTGRLTCASCMPSGAPPVPGAEVWQDVAAVPVGASVSSTFMSRFMNAEGTQVYFGTSQPLVPQDSNHRQDVYEWQGDGSGGCSRAAGCVHLLSGGDSQNDAFFVDASESGGDVFFATREQLVTGAQGETVKLYDARVGGGFQEASTACTGSSCRGVPSPPPALGTPSSATFGGSGNTAVPLAGKSAAAKRTPVAQLRAGKLAKALKTCKRDRSKSKRAVCESRARKRYGTEKAGKASNERRAKR